MNPVMPVFVLLSLLSHLLVLINLAKITATPQPGDAPQDSNSLSVRIYKPPPRAIAPK